MTTPAMHHAFISFSSKDEKEAHALCDDMERRGVTCWISSRDVRPGRNYQTEIIEAIRSASHMLLVFSTNSARSEEVSRELSLASKNQLRICPVRIEDVQPFGAMEFMLAVSQWVDAFDDWDRAMDRLAAEVGDPALVKKVEPAPAKSRAAVFAGVGVLLIAAAGAGGYLLLGRRQPPPAPLPHIVMAAPPAALVPPPVLPPVKPAAPIVAPPPDAAAVAAKVQTLAGSLDCARVTAAPDPNGGIALSGFVKVYADEQRLIATARPFGVQNAIQVEPWPFCAVRSLGPALGARDDISIEINHPDGRYALGDDFAGSFIVTGDEPMWVRFDLIDATGSVADMLPTQPAGPVGAGERVMFGAPKGKPGRLVAGEPVGPEVMLLIESDQPLPPRMAGDDDGHTYLPRLRDTLGKLGATLAISVRGVNVVRQR